MHLFLFLQFRSVEEAAAACLIEEPYGKCILSFTHMKELVQEEVIENPLEKLSKRVEIGNLPKKIFKVLYSSLLKKQKYK